jgi:hypothetical protein
MKNYLPFNVLILLIFILLALSEQVFPNGFSKSYPHIKIEIHDYLSNTLRYEFKISHLNKNQTYYFDLNGGLDVKLLSSGNSLDLTKSGAVKQYQFVNKVDNEATFEITGRIIDPEAVGPNILLLSSSSNWFPRFSDLMSYELIVRTNKDVKHFSPSETIDICGDNCVKYLETRQQEDIYLVIGKLFEYKRTFKEINLGLLLLSQDDLLAEKYLNLLPEFIDRYEAQIGKYPYKSFYVIENFNETGLGMPGFTLLGSSVLRLPFILRSSLPHEVLHNWWGNSVFVDFQRGNWCEGLATYGADHYEQELLGRGAQYRRDALVSFEDFVKTGQDFPLTEFKGRHNEASQAIGYGKGMMFFHMLRKWVSDGQFYQGLKSVFLDYKFSRISFEDFALTFAKLNPDKGLEKFFSNWTKSLGAIELAANSICDDDHRSVIEIRSTPKSLNYILPYVITTAATSEYHEIEILDGVQNIVLPKDFKGKVTLDPKFDVFRSLNKGEKPLTLSRFLTGNKIYVLSEESLTPEVEAWIAGLNSIFKGQVTYIKSREQAEAGATILYYGFRDLTVSTDFIPKIANNRLRLKNTIFEIDGQIFDAKSKGWVIMAFDPLNNQTLLWANKPDSVLPNTWGKQLTHYSKFGILFFDGKTNLFKTSLTEEDSGLVIDVKKCIE